MAREARRSNIMHCLEDFKLQGKASTTELENKKSS
jgi:hypothetical protein